MPAACASFLSLSLPLSRCLCVLSLLLAQYPTMASAARRSTRTPQAPITLAEEQAAASLSRMEERDVAQALLSSLRDSWSDEDDGSDAAEESADEDELEEPMQEEEEEKQQQTPAVDDDGWSSALHDVLPTDHYTRFGGQDRPLHVMENATPLALLQLFLPLRLMEEFAHHTNAAAPFGWRPTTAQELYAFIGVHIYMGIDRLPETELYWTANYVHTFISTLFSRDRFKQLRRYFSVVEYDPASPLRDPVSHVRSLAVQLNSSFAAHYKASQQLTLDEAMVAFKGRAAIKQYMPMKPHKWGYKVWCLASDNYLLHFEVYEGAEEDASEYGATFDTVMRMVKGYENKHHILFTDSWFTSPTLLNVLLQKGIRCCGSVCRNRKGLPSPSSISKKAVQQLRRGQAIQRQKGDMTACVWKDQKVMWMLYNHTSPLALTTLKRWDDSGNRIPIECPQAIHDYFHHARSVDVINQLHYSYPTGRKSKQCWSRLVWWLLDICIVNAFKLWATQNEHARQLDFRDQLMRQLAEQLAPDQRPQRVRRRPDPDTSLAKDHFLVRTNEDRDCAFCSERGQHRVRSSHMCTACNVHLCIGECFSLYHS